MRLETVKTFILIVLIVISLLLSFALWNYQPNYDSLDDSLANESSLNGSEEFIWTLIEPNKVIFHFANGGDYGFAKPQERINFFQEVKDWGLDDFATGNIAEYGNNAASNYDIELEFPTPLPMEVMDGLFKLDSSNIEMPTWSFQRVYYTLNEDETVGIEFVSIDGRNKATAVISEKGFYETLQSYMDIDELIELTKFTEGGTEIYIPKDKMSLSRQAKTIIPINPNDLVDVLFQDPSIVRQSTSSNRGTTYFTDSSQMRITQSDALMEFVSPAVDNDELLFAEDLLNKSIAHLNSYSGWTDEYKLMDINVSENHITYQMYYLAYPVFGQLSTIEQQWGQRLIEYQRPLFRIDKESYLSDSMVEIPSGEDIIDYLINDSSYELENITDIQIGYELNYKSNDRYTIFDPSWFIHYGNNWIPINPYDEKLKLEGGD